MNSPQLWIGTSWKMNKTLAEATSFATALGQSGIHNSPETAIQPFVIPPFTAVREVKRMLADTPVKVGAQNMHWADDGAWTGEVSPPMLTDCGLDIVELGHSERREYFGETDETVGLKVEAAVRHGLTPLICVGESREARDAGHADDVLAQQVRGALGRLGGSQRSAEILIAYEPIWAIGVGGTPASAEYANDRQAAITAVADETLGRSVPCLYGGSVNPGNCVELIHQPHIDGLFIGRSAWDVDGYLDILQRCGATLTDNPES